jgi:ATP-dependent helicase/nuclease subunit A
VIRLAAPRDTDFWTALARCHEIAASAAVICPDLPDRSRAVQEKVARFMARLTHWRTLARRESVAGALEAALADTGYEAALHRETDVTHRLRQVRHFLAMARRFDRQDAGGLSRFLGYLEDQAAVAREGAGDPSAGGDAVRVLSIHASKGLEFPIVVVARLGSRFNLQDQQASLLIDDALGLAPRVVKDGRSYPSLAWWLAQRRQFNELLGEELRLLYVALTRASDRLVLVGTVSDKASTAWTAPISAASVAAASHPMAWLGPALTNIAGSTSWAAEPHGGNALFEWRVFKDDEPALLEQPTSSLPEPPVPPAPPECPAVPDLEARLNWTYPALAATQEAAKASVTTLRRRAAAAATDSEARPHFQSMRMGASTADDLSAAERGVLHHRFFERVDIARTTNREELDRELDRLIAEGWFTPEEAQSLDMAAVERFWSSPLGRSVLAAAPYVRREWPFTVRLHVPELRQFALAPNPGLGDAEFVVTQGVIDLAVVAPDSVWLLDFKTDAVQPGAFGDKVAAYRPQLALYAHAVQEILGRTVSHRWLHFLATGDSVEV